jgi:hypothetical protein
VCPFFNFDINGLVLHWKQRLLNSSNLLLEWGLDKMLPIQKLDQSRYKKVQILDPNSLFVKRGIKAQYNPRHPASPSCPKSQFRQAFAEQHAQQIPEA